MDFLFLVDTRLRQTILEYGANDWLLIVINNDYCSLKLFRFPAKKNISSVYRQFHSQVIKYQPNIVLSHTFQTDFTFKYEVDR